MGMFDSQKHGQKDGLNQVSNTSISSAVNSLGMEGSPLIAAVVQLIIGAGGFSGLARRFQTTGMGHILNSWIGTGSNERVDANHIETLFSRSAIEAAANDNGLPFPQLMSELPRLLPQLMDRLTPTGDIPSDEPSVPQILSAGLAVLRNTHA